MATINGCKSLNEDPGSAKEEKCCSGRHGGDMTNECTNVVQRALSISVHESQVKHKLNTQ